MSSSAYGSSGPPKGYSNPRRAPTSTEPATCQRCYQKGHFTFECTAVIGQTQSQAVKRPRNDDPGPPPDTRNPLQRSNDPTAARYTAGEIAEIKRVLRVEVLEELQKSRPDLFPKKDVDTSSDSDSTTDEE